jgi:hypothetical protein
MGYIAKAFQLYLWSFSFLSLTEVLGISDCFDGVEIGVA